MNDYITTTKQSTTKPCAYFLGYTVHTAIHLTHIVNLGKLISEELGLSNVNGYVLWHIGLLHQ